MANYFRAVGLQYSGGDFTPLFPNDPPGTMRTLSVSNPSGQALVIRSISQPLQSANIESNAREFLGLFDTGDIEARSFGTVVTQTYTVSFFGGVEQNRP